MPFRVTYIEDPRLVSHDRDSDKRMYGEIRYCEQSVRLNDLPNAHQMLRSFVHEAIHAVIDQMIIRELYDEEMNQRETAVGRLANGIAEVLESSMVLRAAAFRDATVKESL